MIIINKSQVTFKINYKDGSYEGIFIFINNKKKYEEVLRSISDIKLLLRGDKEGVINFNISEDELIMIRSSEVKAISVKFN